MICRSSETAEGRASPGKDQAPPGREEAGIPAPCSAAPSLYGASFWQSYVANTLVMSAVAMLFRYADFVTYLGGSELHLGWIVGIGMVGSLATRLFVGVGIDRYGARPVWTWSLAVFALSCLAHLAIHSYRGPSIYVVRIVYCSAIAGVFGSSMTYVSGRAPAPRMAEMLGMLGTSGFLGVVLGTALADMLCGVHATSRWQVDRMFIVAAGLSALAVVFAWAATRGARGAASARRPPALAVLRRYHPGAVLLVGIGMGLGLGLPSTFLPTFAAELNVGRISVFFAVYAPTAIITRVITRRMPERFGLPRMVLASLGVLVASLLAMMFVSREWHFVLPAIGFGIAHAVLYPAAVAQGTAVFPPRYRGLGMTLMLATYDLGLLLGSPLAGAIVHYSSALDLPGYPSMFMSVAVILAAVGGVYAWTLRGAVIAGSHEKVPVAQLRQASAKRAATTKAQRSRAATRS